MSQLEALTRDTRARQSAEYTPQTASREAEIEAERYWSVAEYARVLGKSGRWVRDHCNARYRDLAHSRVGDEIKFSAADRAENARRMAVRPPEPQTVPDEQPGTLSLPTDPKALARLLDDVRRVSA